MIAGASSSLTLQVVLTLRKLVSLLLSVVLFANTFTGLHWVGAAFLFGGTFLYFVTTDIEARADSDGDGDGSKAKGS